MKLYELTDSILYLIADSDDGELRPDATEALDALSLSLNEKVQAVCQCIRQLEADALVAGIEAGRLKELAEARAARAEWLRGYLKGNLEKLGTAKVKTDLFEVRVQANPPSVDVECDPKELPIEFMRIVTTVTADRSALLAAWKASQPLPVGVMIRKGTHLRIR